MRRILIAPLAVQFLVIPLIGERAMSATRAVSRISNGGFERGTAPWDLSGSAALDPATHAGGARSLSIRAGGASQAISGLPAGSAFTLAASSRTEGIEPTPGAARGYAYLAVYQIDEFGDLVSFHDFLQATGSRPWSRASFTFTVDPETSRVEVRAGLFQAAGTLWIDDVALLPGDGPADFDPGWEADSANIEIEGFAPGPRGNVAILDEAFPPLPREGPGAGHASSPAHLAAVLRAAGFGVGLIDGRRIAEDRVLDRSRFDALVLPFGPQFPAAAAASLRRYLRSGGKLVTLGGYAFDALLEPGKDGWTPCRPPPARGPGDVRWHCQLPAASLRARGPLTFSAWTRTSSVSGEMFAFLAVYQYGQGGRLVTFHDLCQLRGTRGWEHQVWKFPVEPAAERVDLMAGILSARGAVWFDELVLRDAAGKEVVADPTESDLDPDLRAEGKWWRSDRDLLTIDAATAHAGKRSFKAKLRGAPAAVRINTRHGQPADGLSVDPEQLGMFDPDFPLERAVRAEAAPGQPVFPAGFLLEGPLAGWAATGVSGGNAARWIPLLVTADRHGRPRGAAGAMLRFHGGPYAGSSWAFFGLTGRDPFDGPAGERALEKLLESLIADTSLAWLKADPPCVRPGEAVRLSTLLRNGSRRGRKVLVSLEAAPPGAETPAFRAEEAVEVAAGGRAEVSFEWRPERWPADFIALRASVRDPREGSLEPVDSHEGGLVAWDEALVRSAPRLSFEGNYLRLGGRPLVLFGTDDYGHVFTSERETPLEWLRDAVKRRDSGINIYENLQVGYIREKLDPVPEGPTARERFFRQTDGIVQLTQAHGQVFFPCILCGYDVAVDDRTLEEHAAFAGEYARRYRDVPGLIYYLNGDLRCGITAAVKPHWNEFLRGRYGTTAALREAWGALAPAEELGDVAAEDYGDRGRAWDDVLAYDANRFRAWLIRRWTGRLIRAIREADPTHPTTCEFYQLPHAGVDVPAAIGDLDLSNIGYFDRPVDDIRRLPAVLALSDQRARGKSLGPGEYGVKTHPAWGDGRDHGYHIARTPEQAIELFLAVAHYTLGLGGSRLHNWCWKDGSEWIFPWGLVHSQGGVEKDTLRVLRNQSLLFRHLHPVYRPQPVYLLTPDSHRLGGAKWEVTEGILASISLLQSTHADLGILNEDSLTGGATGAAGARGIPPEAKVVFYPLPFTPPDAAFEALLEFVRRGGVLYLSGDISFDELRRRTRAGRLLELCGVRFRSAVYEGIAAGKVHERRLTRRDPAAAAARPASAAPADWTGAPCIAVEPAGAEPIAWTLAGEPAVFKNRVGKGWVVFSLDPLELRPSPENRPFHIQLYRDVLALAGAPPLPMTPDSPDIHLFQVPLRDGGRALVLQNTVEGGKAARVAVGGERPIVLEVPPRRPALVWFDGSGRLRAVEALSAEAGGRRVTSDSTGGALLSLDGADIRRSSALLFLPLAAGEARLAREAPLRGPMGEVGEISGGRWRSFEPAGIEGGGEEIRIRVTEDQAKCLIIIGEPEALAGARASLERAVLHPESLE